MTSSKQYALPDDINSWEAENIFYLKSPLSRLSKMLAQYEIYQQIASLPGAIVECGVYKGASLMRFASFRRILENDDSRKIYGFDAFGKFPTEQIESKADKTFIENFEEAGGAGITKEDLESALTAKGFSNFELIKGNIFETLPQFLETSSHLRIALLHLDMDVYEPTDFAIEKLLPHMTPGGLIVFDDYNSVEGATRAADELCRKLALKLRKLPYYNVPAFVKT